MIWPFFQVILDWYDRHSPTLVEHLLSVYEREERERFWLLGGPIHVLINEQLAEWRFVCVVGWKFKQLTRYTARNFKEILHVTLAKELITSCIWDMQILISYFNLWMSIPNVSFLLSLSPFLPTKLVPVLPQEDTSINDFNTEGAGACYRTDKNSSTSCQIVIVTRERGDKNS